MAANVPLTFHQGNDEVINMVVTPVVSTDDLSLVTQLVVVIKPDQCTADSDSTVLTLSSADPTEIVITTQTAAQIVATAYVPAAYLAVPYSRWWRLDAYVGTAVRTAMYGAVTLIDL
jgi:hypothetical protein